MKGDVRKGHTERSSAVQSCLLNVNNVKIHLYKILHIFFLTIHIHIAPMVVTAQDH